MFSTSVCHTAIRSQLWSEEDFILIGIRRALHETKFVQLPRRTCDLWMKWIGFVTLSFDAELAEVRVQNWILIFHEHSHKGQICHWTTCKPEKLTISANRNLHWRVVKTIYMLAICCRLLLLISKSKRLLTFLRHKGKNYNYRNISLID